jgi:hypothetical protein
MCYAHLLIRYRSSMFLFRERSDCKLHPDLMVTLCPHRAKKLHPSRASHLALQHYRGGCPVPRVASLLQRQFAQHTLTHRTNLLPHGSVFLAFYSSSNSKIAAFGDRRPVKDSC